MTVLMIAPKKIAVEQFKTHFAHMPNKRHGISEPIYASRIPFYSHTPCRHYHKLF
jgi:hypothetical protein